MASLWSFPGQLEEKYFDELSHLFEKFEGDIPQLPFPRSRKGPKFEWVDCGEGKGRLFASLNWSLQSFLLYRGQTRRYSPSYAAIYRILLSETDPEKIEAEYWLEKAKAYEFSEAIRSHPAIQFAKEFRLHTDDMALAQHYGIKTDLLDLTENFRTAAFFASHDFIDGVFQPIYSGLGYIYQLSPKHYFTRDRSKPFGILENIGLQLIPRPGEQQAWTLRLQHGEDFETLPSELYVFRRNPREVDALTKMYAKRLLARNEVSDLATRINTSHTCSRKHLEIACRSEGSDLTVETIARKIELIAKKRVVYRIPKSIPKEALRIAAKRFRKRMKWIQRNVSFRPVYS